MKNIYQNILKSLLIGAVYVLAMIVGGVIVSALGLSLPQAKDVVSKMASSFAGGVIAGLCLGPIAASIPAARTRHLVVWGSIIFLNLASVAIEGFFFVPGVMGKMLPGLLVQLFFASLATGWMITILFAATESAAPVTTTYPPIFSLIWRFPASALTYVFFYFIFGAANYFLITRPYYETHVGGLTVPAINVTLTAELIRGVLITLSILPLLFTMRANKTRLAIHTGFILFAIGGIIPLTLQVGVLPLFLLAASAVEIFFQNFSTGFVVARLMSIDGTNRKTNGLVDRVSLKSQ